jgi:hypothetical protein
MKRLTLLTFSATFIVSQAYAADVSGAGALALASIVAEYAPRLSAAEKRVMARFLSGSSDVIFPANKTIRVEADSVECKASSVAIVEHFCELKFGAKTRTISGRKAHELYATLIEVGVPAEGAAGSIYENIKYIACTINPNELKQNSGGGATCRYKTDAP